MPPYNRLIDVLLVCTANQCRSPMAAALLQRHLAASRLEVGVSSAGLLHGGHPATAHAQATMAERNLDLSTHRSRTLDQAILDAADLVIGMTREHVREVAVLDRAAMARTFTLRELERAATEAGPRHVDEPMEAWLARVGAGRKPGALVGVGHDDAYDIADPVGKSRADYEATATELDRLLGAFVALAWPVDDRHGRERSA